MRKSLALTLALCLLAAGGLLAAHRTVHAARDAVAFEETVLLGDRSAAQGVAVDVHTTVQGHLHWDSRVTLATQTQSDTAFTYTAKETDTNALYYNGVMLDYYSGFAGMYSPDEDTALNKIQDDVASRTAPGERHTETVYLADYCEYYPLALFLDVPMTGRDGSTAHIGAGDGVAGAFQNYFRIPVRPEHQVKVSVDMDEAGKDFSTEYNDVDGTGVYIDTCSARTDDACYFAVNARAADGSLLDMSRIPGGYGIYRLAITPELSKDVLPAGALETVYALDETAQVVELQTTEDQKRLLLTTQEAGATYLTVLELAGMTQVARFKLLESDEGWLRRSYYGADFAVLCVENTTVLITDLSGAPCEALRLEIRDDDPVLGENAGYYEDETAVDWDGERLAIVCPLTRMISTEESVGYDWPTCGFALSVYDAGGLRYAGAYDCPLSADLDPRTGGYSSYNCLLRNNRPLAVYLT